MKHIFFLMLELLGINAAFRFKYKGRIKCLMYHNVVDKRNVFSNAITSHEFESQLVYLKKYYNLVKLTQDGEWEGLVSHKVNVLLTFDDGFINNFSIAFPLLKKHGIPACFFMIANCADLGLAPQFSEKYMNGSASQDAYRTICAPQAREMIDAGMTMGAHSFAHDDYLGLSCDEGIRDAIDSREKLEKLFAVEIRTFAFPWGRYWPLQPVTLKRYFKKIFTTNHGFNRQTDSVLNRNEVANTLQMYGAASGSLDFFSNLVSFGRSFLRN